MARARLGAGGLRAGGNGDGGPERSGDRAALVTLANHHRELERRMRISDKVLRHLTVQLERDWAVGAKEQVVKDAQAKAEAEARRAAAEAEGRLPEEGEGGLGMREGMRDPDADLDADGDVEAEDVDLEERG